VGARLDPARGRARQPLRARVGVGARNGEDGEARVGVAAEQVERGLGDRLQQRLEHLRHIGLRSARPDAGDDGPGAEDPGP
jgi:hypothetical protein